MGDAGWGYGHSTERDSRVAQVLESFAIHGGQLFGARRWAENPLTLTHVRWVGPSGAVLDGFRRPQDDDDQMLPVERDVWVQLALHFPTTHSSPTGFDAPWLPLTVEPAQAASWSQAVNQALSARRFVPQADGMPQFQSYPQSAPQGYSQNPPQGYPQNYPTTPMQSPWHAPEYAAQSPVSQPGWTAERRIGDAPAPYGMSREDPRIVSAGAPKGTAHAGAADGRAAARFNAVPQMPVRPDLPPQVPWDAMDSELPEVSLLPSVEIELPPLMPAGGPAGRREFARDSALVFVRALRPLPQVRELRGWMRGERLVLAARYVASIGNRTATFAEMDSATRHVADALARHTLPYAWLGFAEPGEWTQGAALPE